MASALLSLDVAIPRTDKSERKKLKKQRKRAKKESEGDVSMSRGVIYVGHLPHGFYEAQLKDYFSQFGTVTKVHVSRNKKTGRCKGFAFVEFACDEVAKIAAETMNNYLMFNKLLKCQFVDPERVHRGMLGGCGRRLVREVKAERRRQLAQKQHNKGRSVSQHQKRVSRLVSSEERKRKKLETLGIDYDFPGYRVALQGTPQHKLPSHVHFQDADE